MLELCCGADRTILRPTLPRLRSRNDPIRLHIDPLGVEGEILFETEDEQANDLDEKK